MTLVARRKIAFVLILFGMMALILSPWTDSPARPGTDAAVTAMLEPDPAVPEIEPVVFEAPASLTIAVAMDEPSFRQLADQNLSFRQRHRDIKVTLTRVEPDESYSYFRRASELEEAPDIMLMKSEWVNEFAASGYLLPAEEAYAGKALAEQFDALSAPVKWNGYLWGVPLDIDPYVLVWNERLLSEWLGESVVFPLTAEQWTAVAARSAETFSGDRADGELPASPVSWLTIDPADPYALLAWLETWTGERTDALWKRDAWDESKPFGGALAFLEARRAGIRFAATAETIREKLESGETLAAAMPYSAAMQATGADDSGMLLDASSWKLPYVWPRGTSYVISADTAAEDAAATWIAEMTDASVQLSNVRTLGKLPVYRSLYESDVRLKSLLPATSGKAFPNVAPTGYDPSLPARLQRLGDLWQSFAAGQTAQGDWKSAWNASLSDLQHDD